MTEHFIQVDEEVNDLLLAFVDYVQDFAENRREDCSVLEAIGERPRPWGDSDDAVDIVLWALGFYFDPDRQMEADEWDLMEQTESVPISLLQVFWEKGLTEEHMSNDPNDPPGTSIRQLTDPKLVWEELERKVRSMRWWEQ